MKAVIVINGRPRSGKDTAIELMCRSLNAADVVTASFSSIDPVRELLMGAGFDVSAKTPADRDLLAEVGDSTEKYNHFRSESAVSATLAHFAATPGDAVMFLHARESAVIERVKRRLAEELGGDCTFHKVHLISQRGIDVLSNAADSHTGDVAYDAVLTNNGTISELALGCDRLLTQLGVIKQLSLLL